MSEFNASDAVTKLSGYISDTISKDKNVLQFLERHNITDNLLKQAVHAWLTMATCCEHARKSAAHDNDAKQIVEYCERIMPHIEDTLIGIPHNYDNNILQYFFDHNNEPWLAILANVK